VEQCYKRNSDLLRFWNNPVNTAGFVARHMARGDILTVAPETWQPDGEFLLDVRDTDEVAGLGKLKDAVNIPFDEPSDRLGGGFLQAKLNGLPAE